MTQLYEKIKSYLSSDPWQHGYSLDRIADELAVKRQEPLT